MEHELAALAFCKENEIEIRLLEGRIEKHPGLDLNYKAFTIQISKNERSFSVKFGEADLGLTEDEKLSALNICYKVLSRLPKYHPGTFEQFKADVSGADNESNDTEVRRWYHFECELYDNASLIFGIKLNELAEAEWLSF